MPGHHRIPPDALQSTVNGILAQYGESVRENVNDAVKEVTKNGVKQMKAASRGAVGGTGKYAGGWTSQMETGRLSAQGTVYNGTVPGLPHLLEHGHALRNGGRASGFVAAHPHIAKVEQKMIEEFETKVNSKI